ncbi:MAG: RagB/SusD family nutrient uptake outer membrane protein [Chitinophagaceae bacterium]|nr:RagB/SusD family nutrient uptake outer membrane protein [Chitinophagaceae bacterium]
MKNINIKNLAWCLLTALMSVASVSCKKSLDESLDITPHDRLTDEAVFSDANTADVFLNDIYGQLPDGNNMYDPFDNWSDNSICGFPWPLSRSIAQQANYTPSTLSFSSGLPYDWTDNYKSIRKANLFIKKITASVLPDEYKKKRIAEVRMLRAFFYHQLWMCYGGVPIITEPDNLADGGDAIFHSRNTFDETVKFITDELSAVSEDLPESNEAGRVTKGAALTLKGWCELFAHNFADAAATNKKIIDDLGNGNVYDLHPDYQSLFLTESNINKEGILYRQYIPRVKGGFIEGTTGPTFTKGGAETSWGGVNPTQELVDDYEMDNGLPITDPASGYDPQTPYVHREKRFYQSIVFDGSFWYNDTIYTRQGVGSPNEIDLSDHNDAGQTGYYLRKRLSDKITLGPDNWDGHSSGQNYYIFRYAEVLLNYAEAQNEAVGPDGTVYDAIDKVRARSSLIALPAGLSQDQMRQAIRRERRVELAFEDKRWWDLIRWHIADVNLNTSLHGISIQAGANGKLIYNPITVPGGNHKFNAASNYLFPIPQAAIDQNKNLKQNAGY